MGFEFEHKACWRLAVTFVMVLECCFDLIVNLIATVEKPISSSFVPWLYSQAVLHWAYSQQAGLSLESAPGSPCITKWMNELKQSNLSNNFSVSGTGESVKILIQESGTLLTCGDGLCDWQDGCNKQILISNQQDEGKRHQDQQQWPNQEMGFQAQFPLGPLCGDVTYYTYTSYCSWGKVVTFYFRIPLYSDKCRWIRHYYLQLLCLGNGSYAAYRVSFSSWCGLF